MAKKKTEKKEEVKTDDFDLKKELEDLKKDKNYVIFIDDINNINAIEQILY